jgi:predicted signal transduction protein with EAL and GGDEF domain
VAIENVRLHAEAERLSVTDPLTGPGTTATSSAASGRRSSAPAASAGSWPAHAGHRPLQVVNDRFGHQRGDEALVEFAGRVTGSVRDIDTFARYGGEEFVLILPETNLEGGPAVAEKLRLAAHRAPSAARGARAGGPGAGCV